MGSRKGALRLLVVSREPSGDGVGPRLVERVSRYFGHDDGG